MRIALFGGTFDPPHCGHLAVAKAAADKFSLDQVLFAPTGFQPLKREPATDFATRMGLVAAACKSDPRFIPSNIDAPRPDHAPNYTVDTLTALAASHPNDKLFNLVGADSFLDLRRWRNPDRLLQLAEWIVATRPGYALEDKSFMALDLTANQHVNILAGVEEDISATSLRERLHQGDPCADLLPPLVTAFIAFFRLYQK